MIYELKMLGLKLLILVSVAPMIGFFLLKFIDEAELAWKTNNRRKKWIACCILFMFLAAMLGWLG